MKKKNKTNKIFKIVGTISFMGVFTILIITLYNNITLNNKNKELDKYLAEYKELKKEIETEDSKRYEFHKYYTNEIWGMSNGYELCLDEGILGIDGCVKMILDYLKIRNLI